MLLTCRLRMKISKSKRLTENDLLVKILAIVP